MMGTRKTRALYELHVLIAIANPELSELVTFLKEQNHVNDLATVVNKRIARHYPAVPLMMMIRVYQSPGNLTVLPQMNPLVDCAT